jgi:hypothetical protein
MTFGLTWRSWKSKSPAKPEQSMAATRSTGGLATDEILAEVGFQPQRMPANLGFVRRSFIAAAFQVIRGLGFMLERKEKTH